MLQNIIPERFRQNLREQQRNQDEQDDILAQRRAWAGQTERAEEEHMKVSPALWAAENEAREDLERIRQEAAAMIKKAEKDYEQARRERQRADERRDAVVDPCQRNLYATRNPKIELFSRRLEARRRDERPAKEWGRTQEGREVVIASTGPSLRIVVNRINEIICHELRKVELEPLDDAELVARLQQLEQSIPEIEMVKL